VGSPTYQDQVKHCLLTFFQMFLLAVPKVLSIASVPFTAIFRLHSEVGLVRMSIISTIRIPVMSGYFHFN